MPILLITPRMQKSYPGMSITKATQRGFPSKPYLISSYLNREPQTKGLTEHLWENYY
jgi:hypothetical protein